MLFVGLCLPIHVHVALMTENDPGNNLLKHLQNTQFKEEIKRVNVLNYKECAVKFVSKKLHLDCSEQKSKHRITRIHEQHIIFAVCI